MDVKQFEYLKLKKGQQKAFFSYDQIFKNSTVHLDALVKTVSAMANAIGGDIFVGFNIQKS